MATEASLILRLRSEDSSITNKAGAMQLIRALFVFGLLIRVVLFFMTPSEYATKLFIPFLDHWAQNPLSNPWIGFDPKFFPYGGVLFAILAVPKYLGFLLFGEHALGDTLLSLILFKGPLLVLDLALLRALERMAPSEKKRLHYFYWLNPILIYITYIHGQLDLAAMCFTFLAFRKVFRDKIATSALLMACATLCKFHVAAIIPVWLVYLWNRNFFPTSVKKISTWLVVYGALCIIGFAPVLGAGRISYVMTSSPEALRLFAAHISLGADGPRYFIGITLVFAALLRVCLATRISERGLVFGCGLIFGTLVFVTNPGPGWFFWVIPFLSLLFAQNHNVPRLLWLALMAAYFTYFVITVGRLPTLLVDISFTAMQSLLGSLLVYLYFVVVRSEAALSHRSRPLMIGIAGESGAGKNTLSTMLRDVFDPATTMEIAGDDYHKWERGHEAWQDYTPLSPKANELHSMLSHTHQLWSGRSISNRSYDHVTGKFTLPRTQVPQKTMIVQGLHTFYLRRLRDQFDLKVFLNPDQRLRTDWKIHRDMTERGHSPEAVLTSMKQREPDSIKHIQPQKEYADWTIECMPLNSEGDATGFQVRHTIWNDVPLSRLLEHIDQAGWYDIKLEFGDDDFSRTHVTFTPKSSPEPTSEQIFELAIALFPELRQITRGYTEPRFTSGLNGMTQLVALALVENIRRPNSA